MRRYRRAAHTVFKLHYHFVFVTKYRKPVLRGEGRIAKERTERRIGRPSKVDRFGPLVEQFGQEETEEDRSPLKSVEDLRRARLDAATAARRRSTS